jgi:hypothetical protein
MGEETGGLVADEGMTSMPPPVVIGDETGGMIGEDVIFTPSATTGASTSLTARPRREVARRPWTECNAK